MKDEQIARETVMQWMTEMDESGDPNGLLLRSLLTAALATARRAGFDAAKEQAAEIADHWTTDEQRLHGRGGPARAIRSMEPKP